MQFVGRINLELFLKHYPSLTTDEVVLTDPQEQHIQMRHPEAYARWKDCLQDIVQEPDFIFDDPKHPDTALLAKSYQNTAAVVLRLCTDPSGRKNSIITLWEIKETRLDRYILTHKVLYKRE